MKSTFTVTNVLTQGFNDQQVTLENESACVTIRLKDQREFNKYAKGQSVALTIGGSEKKAESASKKSDKKKAKA